MDWKFSADRPVYQQIVSIIRAGILTGELPPGEKIPSVRDLAAEAQVNPNTMQRALTELEREGLLVTVRPLVTRQEQILAQMRQDALQELARQCAEKFRVFGLSPGEAARLLQNLEEEKEDV